MIIQKGHRLFGKAVVKDISGKIVDNVFYFDTETKLTKIYVTAKAADGKSGYAISGKEFIGPLANGNKVAEAEFILEGGVAVLKATGEPAL